MHIKASDGETNDSAMCYCAFAVTQTFVKLLLLGACEEIDTLTNGLISELEAGRCVNELLESASKALLFSVLNFFYKASTVS